MSSQAQQAKLACTSVLAGDALLLALAHLCIGATLLALESVAPTRVLRMAGCGGRWDAEVGDTKKKVKVTFRDKEVRASIVKKLEQPKSSRAENLDAEPVSEDDAA